MRGLEDPDRAALACGPLGLQPRLTGRARVVRLACGPLGLRGASAGLGRAGSKAPAMTTASPATPAVPSPPAAAPPSSRIADLMFEFLGYLELERGLSRNTLDAYRSDLQQFGQFIAQHQLDPLTITPAELAAFVSERAGGSEGGSPVAAAT